MYFMGSILTVGICWIFKGTVIKLVGNSLVNFCIKLGVSQEILLAENCIEVMR